jgi:hypothetical protein
MNRAIRISMSVNPRAGHVACGAVSRTDSRFDVRQAAGVDRETARHDPGMAFVVADLHLHVPTAVRRPLRS